ncbi:tetratricopeptide repeat protein, partial [Sediminimonas sp.]|uniref:tetratricopeptide repeat protein n=1 Tax=Sediminimonas sp. TaxID=2823379 RepID=UPI0025FC850A
MARTIATIAALCLALFPRFASAQDAEQGCPPPPDHEVKLQALLDQVRAAPDEATARHLSNRMWELWADAPDAVAQEILDKGMRKRAVFDFLGAIAAFDRLVAYCPDYAEGYNQRAFVHFIRQDYAAALTDLDRALALAPDHVAARAGRA